MTRLLIDQCVHGWRIVVADSEGAGPIVRVAGCSCRHAPDPVFTIDLSANALTALGVALRTRIELDRDAAADGPGITVTGDTLQRLLHWHETGRRHGDQFSPESPEVRLVADRWLAQKGPKDPEQL